MFAEVGEGRGYFERGIFFHIRPHHTIFFLHPPLDQMTKMTIPPTTTTTHTEKTDEFTCTCKILLYQQIAVNDILQDKCSFTGS